MLSENNTVKMKTQQVYKMKRRLSYIHILSFELWNVKEEIKCQQEQQFQCRFIPTMYDHGEVGKSDPERPESNPGKKMSLLILLFDISDV